MKILFAGCKKEFNDLQNAIRAGSCTVQQYMDGGPCVQEWGSVADGCDWIILDGRIFRGEMDLTRFIYGADESDKASSDENDWGCSVERSTDGSILLSCGMHKMMLDGRVQSEGLNQIDSAGFVFGYHAPCRPRR